MGVDKSFKGLEHFLNNNLNMHYIDHFKLDNFKTLDFTLPPISIV